MNQRRALRETIELAEQRGMPALPGSDVGLSHLRSMLETVEKSDFSEAKLGRWLGWAQCAVVAANVGVTLTDMKALNMQCAADGDNRPHNCNTPYGPRCWCEQPDSPR